MGQITEQEEQIDRQKGLEFERFRECYLEPHKPVILVDALRDWRAVNTWTPQFFQQTYGDVEVTVDGNTSNLRDLLQLSQESSKEHPAPYLRNYPVKRISEDLLADISPLPEYFAPNWLATHFYPPKIRKILGRAIIPDIFIGGSGCCFPFLHYDLLNSHAFLSQIYGDKSYMLYSPDQAKWLYRSTVTPNRSLVTNVAQPDLVRFPLLAATHPLKGLLAPGEVLFIPAGWWHAASVLTPSITVSINVANSSNWLGLIWDQYRSARSSPTLLNRLAAVPLVAYLLCVGVYRSLVPMRV
jgi:histone arginine demethylase JMJD6